MDSATKVCTKCGEPKPLTSYWADASKKSGLSPSCKACKAAGSRNYYQINKATIERKNAVWAKENAEKVSETKRLWKKRNRLRMNEKARDAAKEKYASNPGKFAGIARDRRVNLSGEYVAALLQMPVRTVPVAVMELKREQLTIYRLSKQLKSQLKKVSK